MVTIHTSAKDKEFKCKFNGFSKTQKLGTISKLGIGLDMERF
jgi:hypothetical protein